MNACRDFHELISLTLDGPLASEDQARLDAHLDACTACRAYRADLEAVHAQIRQVEAVEPPPWLAARIMAQVRAEAAPQPSFWRAKVLPFLVRPEFQAASLLLVCVSSYYLLKSRPEAAPVLDAAPATQAAPEAPAERSRDEGTVLQDAAPAVLPAAPVPMEAEREQRAESRAKKAQPAPELDAVGAGVKGDASGFVAPPPAAEAVAEAAKPAPPPAPAPAQGPRALGGVASEPGRLRENALAAGVSIGKLEKQTVRKDGPPSPAAAAATAPARDEKKARQSHEEAAPALAIHWAPAEPQSARATLEADLAALGATVEDAGQARALRARLDARRLPELLARLEKRGRLLAPRPEPGYATGVVTVLIRW
jgi:hypothetical protein